ncbi:hypothetical protein HZH68_013291 [Vespula germanica]|uniref:Uncharacterized protein n=1 Tax=Vespula germanica TaxID=30212 RepID=A0A834JFJ5_VESGE|nr:hypothetical protein HZH68_013291 [Vespula germanica]
MLILGKEEGGGGEEGEEEEEEKEKEKEEEEEEEEEEVEAVTACSPDCGSYPLTYLKRTDSSLECYTL